MVPSKSLLITGVSTGIGYAAATAFVQKGYRVFGSVREEQDGERLQEELGASFTPLLFDVTDEEGIQRAVEQVSASLNGSGLGGLINNAGIAVGGPLQHIPLKEFQRQFEVNIFGLLRVTQAFLPLLGARPDFTGTPGRILNISSTSGKLAIPFVGPYAASKHALEALSQSLRRELFLYGIEVIIVGPGSVRTPIWDKSADATAYRNTAYHPALKKFVDLFVKQAKKEGLPADYLGQKLVEIMEAPRPRTRYAIVRHKFRNWTLPRLLPDRWLDRMLGKQLGWRE